MSIIPTSMDEPRAETVGIDKERVDPSTLQIIDHLFPAHHGITFLAAILRHASVKQLALPELEIHQVADVAVITVQSIRILAQLIGMSYDTTEKYIVILNQLRLLSKQRQRRQIVLHFPLRPYQLPEPEVLDQLQEMRSASQKPRYRPKVRSFASQVKRRIVLLRSSERVKPPPPSLRMVQNTAQRLAPQLMEDIRAILLQEVDSETGSRLFLKIEGAVHHRCTLQQSFLSEKGDSEVVTPEQQSLLSRPKGDSSTNERYQESRLSEKDDSEKGASDPESRLSGTKGDSLTDEMRQERRLFGQKGDSEMVTPDQKSLLLYPKGDFLTERIHPQSLLFGQKGNSEAMIPGQQSLLSRPKGDSLGGERADTALKSTFSRPKGDFKGVAPALSFNDNVITIHNDTLKEDYDSDNDAAASARAQEDHYSSGEAAKVGRQLALFLEKTPENTGGFVNKCKQCSRTVIRASVIDVLVHAAFPQVDPADERGRPKNRASWFHDACKKYAKPGTRIPGFIEKWHKTDLAWDEIERQLDKAAQCYKRYMIADSRTADLVRQWLRGEIEQHVLDEALQAGALSHEMLPQRAPQPLTSAPVAAKSVPLAVSEFQSSAAVEKTWMDEDEAEALAEEILRDASQFGVSQAVSKQEHGVYVVVLTWLGSTFPMKTPQQWRAHLESVRPEFERRMKQKGENNGTTR